MRLLCVGVLLVGGAGLTACLPAPDLWTAPGVDLFAGGTDTVDGWYRFAEGPSPDPKGGVFFSDLVGESIYHWDPDGDVSRLRQGEATNGLSVAPDGTLYGCEPFARQVVRIDPQGHSHPIAKAFDGQPLNSCNDLWADPVGGVYFTDPLYSKDRKKFQDGEHVYYVPKQGAPIRVINDLVRPNGIVGTPDGLQLYVVDDGEGKTWRYDIETPGLLSHKQLVVEAGADGVALDAEGRVYLVTDVVLIFDAHGKKVGEIKPPFRPTNVSFGGKDGKKLFITGKWVVHIIEMKVAGAGW